MAAVAGIATGLAVSVALTGGKATAATTSEYPLRIALPEVEIIAPSIDVQRTDRPSSVIPADALAARTPLDNAPQLNTASLAAPSEPISIGPAGMMTLDYDLAQFASANQGGGTSDGSVQTSMALQVNGVARGSAQIRVADSAQILIATGSLASAIGEQASSLPPRLKTALDDGTGFLPFYELRAAGIDVQYDPVNDRIALTLPG
ncbi:hypothetical protein HUO12_04665 [Altererythrobacter sp. JGD-16]|uniref:Uncharacterized protein n=1 Tax=Altererythrobacter lutimaris TaxID=2743979 RepID=A0A850HC50_9SPHN|nr:hypothetical protein [Altererythrobacter lutimaris]